MTGGSALREEGDISSLVPRKEIMQAHCVYTMVCVYDTHALADNHHT